jgi:hypothetical protein
MSARASIRHLLQLLAIVSAFCLATGTKEASAATLEQAIQGCNSMTIGDQVTGEVLELLVLAGSDVDQAAQARYKMIAGDAIAWACAAGARLEIRPVDARSREEAYVFSASAPLATRDGAFNPYILRDKRAAFVYGAWAAVDALYHRAENPHADFFGAMEVAMNAVNSMAKPTHARIVVVGHGWQQQDPDLYAAGRDPARSTADFINALRSRQDPPNLHDIAVLFVGVSSGPRDMRESPFLASLCDNFWAPVVRASKGSWGRCWPEMPPFLRIEG